MTIERHTGGFLEQVRERVVASEPVQRSWAYYQSLSARDQRAVMVLGAVLLVLVVVFGVLIPLHQTASVARDRYQSSVEDLAWMQEHRDQAKLGAVVQRQPGQSLLSVVTQSARNHGLSVQRFDPIGEDGVSLGLDQVDFDSAVAWLAELSRSGVRVEEFSASRREQPGQVDLRVVLRG